MIRRIPIVALLIFVLVPSAAAQDPTEVARGHFETGTRAFETGDYELATSEFQQAYDLTRHPDILFNVYSSAERAGQLEQAATALERFLAEAELEPARRAPLEERLARLRQRIAARRAGTPEPPPGPEGAEGGLVEAPDPAPSEPTPVVSSSSGPHPAAIGALIGAGVLAAGFGVFAGLSEAEDGAVAARCGRDAGRTCTGADVSTLEAFNVAADVSWITASVAAVVGVVLLFVLPGESEAEAQAALAPWASPDGAGLVAMGRF